MRRYTEQEAERIERVMGDVTRRELERALAVLLSAIRTAEGEQRRLDDGLTPVLSRYYRDAISNIGASLIEDGIDRVVDLLGADAVDILEEYGA